MKGIYSICFPFFAFLFPVFFVLHGFAQYSSFIPLQSFLFIALRYILYSFLLFGFFFLFYRNKEKTGMAVFITLLFYCLFGAFQDFLQTFLQKTFFIRYIFLLPVVLLSYFFLFLWIKRKKNHLRWFLYLNILFVVLIAIDLGTILFKAGAANKSILPVFSCDTCAKPDVYFIVVDGYAGSEQINNDFSSTNEPFLDSLKDLGFRVLTKSRSNYVRTEFSMASMLNMEYHSLQNYSVTEKTLTYCFQKMARNKVVTFFKNLGYEFVNNSIFDIDNKAASVTNTFLVTGTDLIESETLFSRLKRDIYIPFLMRYLRNTRLYTQFIFQAYESDRKLTARLETIAKAEAKKPRFIYTHLLMTHFPYYFKANGQLNEPQLIRVDNYQNKELYLSNLKFANQRLLVLIRNIFQSSSKPPVIVLISDHGFRYAANSANIFSNLAAIYLPNRHYENYYDSLSNVNQFRVLFNSLYGQHLPLLKDVNGEIPRQNQDEHTSNSFD